MALATGDICGEIRLRAEVADGRIARVDIASTRPLRAARIFEGKPVEDLCDGVGRVFSLCGIAQTIAALTAAEAALAIAPAPGVLAARTLARRAEMLTQTVTRLALHWPRALGLELRPDLVRACLAVEAAIAGDALGEEWRRPGGGIDAPGAELDDRLGELDTLLQAADPGAVLADGLADRKSEAYGALPEGMAPESGALTRTWDHETVVAARQAHGAGLAARLEAGRVEISLLPLMMIEALGAITPAPARRAARASGQGDAVVETARGPLTHRLTIADGVVTACETQAPTEANFAADGPAVAGLIGAPADAVAAQLHVLAIDPCVAAEVEIPDA